MQIRIRKLEKHDERLEAERLIATSFLNEWDEKESEENAKIPGSDAWAAYDSSERMVSAATTLRHEMTYEGSTISCGEIHMVGTLAEARGAGAVRELMGTILREYRDRGDLFATLIPFSFSFYRKYGFEAASEMLIQKADIDQFALFRQEFEARQILSQEDVNEARALYDRFIRRYNLADLKNDGLWAYRGDGEFGIRDWQYMDRPHYSYLFCDRSGTPRAYLTFVFVYGPNGPFTGTMAVTELVFDSPEALRSVFGFFYGMRAKITDVSTELPVDVDLSLMLPECDKVERRLDGHYTARVLNADKVLLAMVQPEGEGRYSIRLTDSFLPENSGTYTVSFDSGKTTEVTKGDGAADIEMTVETFCQLAVGRTGLQEALYRSGTKLNGNKAVLERVFVRKPVYLK